MFIPSQQLSIGGSSLVLAIRLAPLAHLRYRCKRAVASYTLTLRRYTASTAYEARQYLVRRSANGARAANQASVMDARAAERGARRAAR